MYLGDDFPGSTLAKFDPEATSGYEGRTPGTVSAIGYGALYLDQQYSENPPPIPHLVTSLDAMPQITNFSLAVGDRIADIQDFGISVMGTTDADFYNKLRAIIGPERLASLNTDKY
jgi:hypothetical protein